MLRDYGRGRCVLGKKQGLRVGPEGLNEEGRVVGGLYGKEMGAEHGRVRSESDGEGEHGCR